MYEVDCVYIRLDDRKIKKLKKRDRDTGVGEISFD